MQENSMQVGQQPTVLASLLYFDFSLMVRVLLDQLGLAVAGTSRAFVSGCCTAAVICVGSLVRPMGRAVAGLIDDVRALRWQTTRGGLYSAAGMQRDLLP